MLQTNLEQLEYVDLIRRAAASQNTLFLAIEYAFKHGLVQETTYESLLKQDRKRLHRLVAEALEESGKTDELAALLAQHWDEAGETERAFGYYVRAGKNAARVYANTEALMAYQRAIELSEDLELSHDRLLELYLPRGRAYELNSQYGAALENYLAMEEVARARRDRALELAAHLAQIPIYAVPNALFDQERAGILIEQALELAAELHDRAAEARALWLRMLLYARSNRPFDAIPEGERALALARALNLRELMAYAANDLAGVYVSTADFARGSKLFQEANQLWRELGNLPMLADNLSSSANYLLYEGDFDRIFELSAEAYQLSEKIGNLCGQSYSLFMAGLAYVERGEFARGIAMMRECLALGDRAGFLAPHLDTQLDLARAHDWLGATQQALEIAQRTLEQVRVFPVGLPICYATLAELYVSSGDMDRAVGALAQAHETLAKARNLPVYEHLVARAEIIVRLALGEMETAHRLLDTYVAEMERMHVRLYLADAYLFQARALLGLGVPDAAFEAIAQADRVAREIGARRIHWQVLALYAQMESARGNSEQAHALAEKARTIVLYIADHAPVELRAIFLNRADVQALMNPVM